MAKMVNGRAGPFMYVCCSLLGRTVTYIGQFVDNMLIKWFSSICYLTNQGFLLCFVMFV